MPLTYSQGFQAKLRLYLQLIRWDKPVGTLLLLWPTLWGLWLATLETGRFLPDGQLIAVFGLGTWLMRSAGCAINDLADRRFDAHVARTADRVMATGQVSVREALIIASIFIVVAGGLAVFTLNALALKLCIPAVLVAGAYPFFKRFFAVPQAILGIAFGFGILIAYAAVQNALPASMWCLFVANFSWVLSYDTAYAMSDKPDDLKLGLNTSAIFFGRYDAVAVMLFMSIFLGLFAVLLYQHPALGSIAWLGWAGATAYAIYLSPLVFKYPKGSDAQRTACFKLFLANHLIGFLLWLGLSVEALWAFFQVYFQGYQP